MRKDIYIIKNDINNKVYIGQSTNSKIRFQGHCKPSGATRENALISKAIQKYGKEHFWYEILESQIEDYNEKEQYYIKKYNSIIPNGYNILTGGEAPPIMKGENHVEAILSKEQVIQLTEDLKNTKESFESLHKKYGFVSRTSISDFNKGKTYHREIDYPIRKEVTNGKLTEEQIDQIIYLLKNTSLSYATISRWFNMDYKTASRIDKGLLHKRNIEYPIRNKEKING